MFLRVDGSGPMYRQIYRSLRSMVLTGDVPRGSRLPATRSLARDLGVSRNIVLIAYRELVAEGYAEGRLGSGTYAAELPEAMYPAPPRPGLGRSRAAAAPRLSAFASRLDAHPPLLPPVARPWTGSIRYDFRYGLPAVKDFPFKFWRRLLASQARLTSAESLSYGPSEGHAPLREAIADYLRRSRSVQCHAGQVVVVNGAQQALDLVARVLLDPGAGVVIEEPHYQGAREVFLGAGARLVPVPVDREGLDVSRLGRSATTARVVYVTPSHQFPTGEIMSLPRRFALLRWAEVARAYVIEDDYDSEYRYEHRPVEAIHGLEQTGRVIYVGTLSKLLFPALRLGYLVLPEALVKSFRAAKWVTDRHTPTFQQELLTQFLREGYFERHLRRSRATLAARREALLDAVTAHLKEDVDVGGANAGAHLLMWFRRVNAGRQLDGLIARAAKAGVGVYPVTPYYLTPPRRAGLVLGYASLNESEIHEGIERLAMALHQAGKTRWRSSGT